MAATIAKLSGASAKNYYYEEDPIFGETGGNNGDGSIAGDNLKWSGVQAEFLEVAGKQTTKEEFGNLLDNKTKDGEVQLKENFNTNSKKVDAYDLVLAAPKSVSALAIGAEDQDLVKAHQMAVEKTMKFVEENYAFARVANFDEQGNRTDSFNKTDNLAYATATHSTARSDKVSDFHLHSHNVILNQTYDEKQGKFKALAAQEMLKNQGTIDTFYKSELAKEVVKLGYQLEDKRHGFDIKMDQKVIDKFSQRREQIVEQAIDKFRKDFSDDEIKTAVGNAYKTTTGNDVGAKEFKDIVKEGVDKDGLISFMEKTAENLGTTFNSKDKVFLQHNLKAEKQEVSKETLHENWDKKLKEVDKDLTFDKLKENAKGEQQFLYKNEKEVLEKTMSLLTENEVKIGEKQLLKEASNLAVGQFSYSDLKAELDNVKKIGQKEDHEVKNLGVNENGEKEFTTKEMYRVEKENKDMILEMKEDVKAGWSDHSIMSKEEAIEALKDFEDKNFKLSEGQKEGYMQILTDKEQVGAVQGWAGSGKTASLKAVNHALEFQENKAEVTLLAPTNKAVGGAVEDSKLDSGKEFGAKTVAKHVKDIEKGATKSVKPLNNDEKTSSNLKDGGLSQDSKEKNSSKRQSEAPKAAKNDKKPTEADKLKDYLSKREQDRGLKKEDIKSKINADLGVFVATGNKAFKNKGSAIKGNGEGGLQVTNKTKTGRTTLVKGGEFNGAVKKESWNVKKGTYKSEVKFKDGSSFKTEMKSSGTVNRSDFKSAVGSMVGSQLHSSQTIKKTNSKGDESIEKSRTVLGVKSESKEAHNKVSSEKKSSISFAKVAKLEKQTLEVKKGGNTLKTETAKKEIFGFGTTTQKQQVFNKDGELTAQKSVKEKSVFGVVVKREVEIKNIEKDSNKVDVKITKSKNDEGLKSEAFKAATQKPEVKEVKGADKKEALKVGDDNAKIEKKDKVLIVDESSMLGAKDLNKMLKDAKENGSKVVLIGDTQQLQSISAGNAFKNIQEQVKTTEMNQTIRQQTSSEKVVADNARDKATVKKSFNELEEKGRLHEIKDEGKRVDAVASAAVKKETLTGTNVKGEKVEKQVTFKDNLIVANTNDENKKLNEAVRSKLKESGEIEKTGVKATVRETVNMSAIKQAKADNFEKGQIISTFGDVKGMTKGKEYEVKSINTKTNEVLVKGLEKDKNGKDVFSRVNLKEAAGKLNVEIKTEKEFVKGDIVVVNKTNKDAGIVNSERGQVVAVDKDKKTMSVDFGGKTKEIDLSKGDKGVSHGYAITTHKSQGVTVDRVQFSVDTQKTGTSLNNTYVAASRQKLKAEVFTDDAYKTQKMAMGEQVKTTTHNHKDPAKEPEKAKNEASGDKEFKPTEAMKDAANKIRWANNLKNSDSKNDDKKVENKDSKDSVQKVENRSDLEIAKDKNSSKMDFMSATLNKDKEVRVAAASNEKNPEINLDRLAGDREKDVKVAVAGNKSTPEDTLDRLSSDKEKDVKVAVAKNEFTKEDTLDKLSGDKEKDVRLAVAENKDTDKFTLENMAKIETDRDVKIAIVENKNTPENVRDELKIDKEVRKVLDNKVEDVKTPDTKQDDSVKSEDTKRDDVKTTDTKSDDGEKQDTVKQDNVKVEDTKSEDVKAPDIKPDDSVKSEDTKRDDVKTTDTKSEDSVKQDGVKVEDKVDTEKPVDSIKSEDGEKQDTVKQDDTKPDDSVKSEDIKSDDNVKQDNNSNAEKSVNIEFSDIENKEEKLNKASENMTENDKSSDKDEARSQ